MNKFVNVRKAISLALLLFFALLNAVPPLRAQTEPLANGDSKEQKLAGLENYDIRLDRAANLTKENFRRAAGRDESFTAEQREKFAAAENRLRQRVSALVVEYNETLNAPEVIGLDVLTSNGANLACADERTPNAETLRQFIYENDELIGLNAAQIGELKVVADYTNPDGVLSYAHLEQSVNDIPVFQAEIKAGFTKRGEMFRVINNLAPALRYDSLSGNFGDASTAVRNAFKFVEREMKPQDEELNRAESTDLKAVFGASEFAETTAEKFYFPLEAGVARAAWRILIWEREAAYYVVVDAETGTLLWRKNITAHQTQPATYNVYANSKNMIQSLDSPAPFTPGPASPNGAQAPLVSRTNVTLVGNEGANSFNNLGWLTDGRNTTDGNNVEAGIDRDGINGVDAPVAGGGIRVFNFNYTPGNPAGGDDPLLPEFQKGAVTQLFYLSNRYHDELYKLGFTEAARNFQNDNFGRGGAGGDRISAEAQDSSGTDNAFFSTLADSGRGQMQMYLWTLPNPDRDGDLDADIVIHELTHGLSNRLIGNAVGLSGLMGGGMGEGWSDFYAHALLSEASDPPRGIYTVGGYSTQNGSNNNYYYGIRVFPKAVKSFTGGALNRPHNPLTFADIDSTQVNVNDGAFAAGRTFSTNEVHDIGEVWSSALWEVRARFVRRLGFTEGNRRVLQFVTDGMKLTPNNPTFLQARDAIKQAAQAGGTADDLLDVRIGFAIRGMGDTAQITQISPVRVVESFAPNAPTDIYNNPATIVSETISPNNAPDPGETLTISLPLQNYGTANSGANVTATLLNSGGIMNPSAAQNYGTLTAGGAQVSRNFTFDVPASAAAGSQIVLTFQIQDGSNSFQIALDLKVSSPSITVIAPTITSESILPPNNAPDQGETLTVSLPLQNVGNANTGANVTVTLLNSGGIANPSAAQNYGTLTAGGAQVSRNFTLDVPGSIIGGSQIALTFQVQDGATTSQFVQFYTVAMSPIVIGDPVITHENAIPANNALDPGETLTISLPLRNTGSVNTAPNLTVALLNSGGITNPSAAQNYGTLTAGGAQVSRDFTFTVSPAATCGDSITLTFQVQNGALSFNLIKTFRIGALTAVAVQNFDGVTAPALPSGWTSTQSGFGTGWTTSTVTPASAPNAAFAGNPADTGLSNLESPVWYFSGPLERLDFKINYNTEADYDGAVLEIKIGSGAYQDIEAAGGSFTAGGYQTLLTPSTNPLASRRAWSGNSNGWISSSVTLPASANGQTVQFRWRIGSDNAVGVVGVWLDDVQLIAYSCAVLPRIVVVTKTADTNDGVCDAADCSLREALDVADGDNLADVITFNIPANSAGCNGKSCTITLSSELAPLPDGGLLTSIDGATGANSITLSGDGATRILELGTSVNLAADNLNFTRGNGNGGFGGAIANFAGTLTLTNSALYNNSASGGGAILTSFGGVTNLTNVTISGNSAAFAGGGINNSGTVTTTNCTITNNTAQFYGGVVVFNNMTFNARNTIIAGNSAPSSPDVGNNFTSQGYNLIGDASGANGFNQPGDQTGVDARLAPLGYYGGKTLTHPLLDGGATPSPAINTGTATGAPTTDQRGAARIGNVDKGAFEVNNTPNGGAYRAVLPTTTFNSSYQTQITPNNGAFTYSITNGALPNGITLTTNFAPAAVVALQGTPTQPGTFNFAIMATNGTNSNVTNYSLEVFGTTAAGVSVSGRVTVGGRGLSNATVTLTDQNGETRIVRTSSFGYFSFADVEVGRTYIIQVTSKRYQLQPQVISVNEEISDLLITAGG